MSRGKAIRAGFLAGAVAGVVMTGVMLLLANFGIATPLAIIGDRLSVFIPPGPFLSLMGRVGGYNHLKQLGVGSTMAGQLVFGAIGGAIYGWSLRHAPARRHLLTTGGIFVALPLVVIIIVLWPVLGTNYHGLPVAAARWVTLTGLAFSVILFERTLVLGFRFLTRAKSAGAEEDEFSPVIGRRALLLGGFGLVIAGGGAALLRQLFRVATFSYDGLQYKGRGVQAITPNEQFYCVTKNVIDPVVHAPHWRLEITGLVQTRESYRIDRLMAFPAVSQETTLMCISNGLDAGLISNAVWKGVPLSSLLHAATPLPGAVKVRFQGVDNYADTIPLEKAMDPTTLVAYEMNGVPLPQRHGFPARLIVPGYFGEKHVKWITRIEVTDASATGFYEAQGWGPDFITPTRSRIDVPEQNAEISLGPLRSPVTVTGIAYGGDRGISKVEVSVDDGETWADAKIDYPGTKLTWALWSFGWRPAEADDYILVVRATDGEGAVQEWEEDRSPFSGATGFHKIVVHVTA